eukprot:6801014-Prymnesium_polylepis.1
MGHPARYAARTSVLEPPTSPHALSLGHSALLCSDISRPSSRPRPRAQPSPAPPPLHISRAHLRVPCRRAGGTGGMIL